MRKEERQRGGRNEEKNKGIKKGGKRCRFHLCFLEALSSLCAQ